MNNKTQKKQECKCWCHFYSMGMNPSEAPYGVNSCEHCQPPVNKEVVNKQKTVVSKVVNKEEWEKELDKELQKQSVITWASQKKKEWQQEEREKVIKEILGDRTSFIKDTSHLSPKVRVETLDEYDKLSTPERKKI